MAQVRSLAQHLELHWLCKVPDLDYGFSVLLVPQCKCQDMQDYHHDFEHAAIVSVFLEEYLAFQWYDGHSIIPN